MKKKKISTVKKLILKFGHAQSYHARARGRQTQRQAADTTTGSRHNDRHSSSIYPLMSAPNAAPPTAAPPTAGQNAGQNAVPAVPTATDPWGSAAPVGVAFVQNADGTAFVRNADGSWSAAAPTAVPAVLPAVPTAAAAAVQHPWDATNGGWGFHADASAVAPQTVNPEDEEAKAEAEAIKCYESDMSWWCGLRAVVRSAGAVCWCGLSTVAVAVQGGVPVLLLHAQPIRTSMRLCVLHVPRTADSVVRPRRRGPLRRLRVPFADDPRDEDAHPVEAQQRVRARHARNGDCLWRRILHAAAAAAVMLCSDAVFCDANSIVS